MRQICFASETQIEKTVNSIKKTFQFGEHEVTMETGAIARQADGAVIVTMAETSVLVTAVGRKAADPGRSGPHRVRVPPAS